jgi:hypothetical protein
MLQLTTKYYLLGTKLEPPTPLPKSLTPILCKKFETCHRIVITFSTFVIPL